MSEKQIDIDQQEAIQYALAVLKEAGIDARLTELWNGGEQYLVILLKNITNLPAPQGYSV